MAYAAPTISTINAFDATVGTTIDFTIIGGTQVVRSNRIYIYDITDNSLICSHLYVSTDTIHEVPANTSSDWVYATGKSSTDFTNESQYYMKLQAYVDTTGTTAYSGMSNAAIFWCLPTPSLTIGAITTPLSVTSFSATAMFDTNITGTIATTNEPTQWQATLYNTTGDQIFISPIQTDSTQIGTSSQYTMTWNFSGLVDGTSYYVAFTVTSSEGMVAMATSNTFTVSITAPSLGAALAINNTEGGYISVISQLSTEYTSSIQKVLVKRQDLMDVTGVWLTLGSLAVASADDLNFTYIDFTNQHGATYVYAIVPVIQQNQGGVTVEIEGEYTISEPVESCFDGVFLCDQTGIQKFVAGVGYGDATRHQAVGVIETIGGKYPIVVSNSNMNYNSGSVTAYSIGDGLYTQNRSQSLAFLVSDTGQYINTDTDEYIVVSIMDVQRLDRQSIRKLRQTIEQFLVNKKAKILKDWNGNIWIVMITDNISITWTNDWGMGITTLDMPWTEIGDATNQNDLIDCGIIQLN